jgi:hypothetical protein
MTLRTMDDVRRELRRLLDELKGKGTPRPHPTVKERDLFAAFRQLELTDQLREELIDEGLRATMRRILEEDTVGARRGG